MKLYYSPGACSQAVHLALVEADIPHTLVKVDLTSKRTEAGEDYLDINPMGYVPALELEDGQVLTEAPAILQFVADLNPKANLAPENGTLGRVRLQEQLNYLSSELHKAFGPFFAADKPEGEAREQALTKLSNRLDALERHLSGKQFILGDEFTVADAYAFVVASWSHVINFDLGSHPTIQDYVDRIANRPAVKAVYKAEGLA